MLGEEFGVTGGGSRRWIVDPIDGTRNYSRGIPVWATLIALEEDGAIRLGVVSAPALGRRWWAERGAGAFVERRSDPRLRASPQVEDAVLCFALEQPLPAIAHRCWHPRALRRLLGAHARRRGCRRRRDRRDRRQGLGSRRAPADRRGGRRALQRQDGIARVDGAHGDLVERAPARRRCSKPRAPSSAERPVSGDERDLVEARAARPGRGRGRGRAPGEELAGDDREQRREQSRLGRRDRAAGTS